jgi:Regulator of chromosome condensation (RCC1) repeat
MSLPAGVTGTAIAAGQDTSYAIGSDRNLSASGENEVGQLGDGTDTGPDVCTQPLGLPNEPCSTVPVRVSLPSGVTLTAIAAGYESGYAIGSDSHLYAWGANSDGERGDGTTTNADTPVQVSLPTGVTATAIAGGNSTAYAIGSSGKLCAWGENNDGQLGNGTTSSSDTPVQVSLPTGVRAKALAGGSNTGYAIGSDGKLYSWGFNADGELGDCSTTGRDGELYAWGENYFGELGDGSNTGADCADGTGFCSTTPVLVSLPPGSTPLTLGSMKLSQSAFAILATEPLPTTQVLVPRTGAHLFGLTFLDASAKHASSVEFRLFGGSYGYAAPVICTAEATIFGWLCLWNASTVPKGSYVLVSEAFNSAGSTHSVLASTSG